MIPFDFVYCRPSTLQEAAQCYSKLRAEGKNPVYYAGGSEIITMCRAGSIQPGAVIDIKNIPECMLLATDSSALHVGAACTLNEVKESKRFRLLELACGRIADHTNQCRITLGGNLCGTIIYRETSLPLLLTEATVTVYGSEGERIIPFRSVFNGQLHLEPGELLVQAHIPSWALTARHVHVKHTRNEKIDYPLVSMAGIWQGDFLRIAFSGICSYPFRSEQIESVINERTVSCIERAEAAAALLPEKAYSDVEGSGEYRVFVLRNMLEELLEDWENGKL